jgi:hypothetical protein
MSKPSKKRTSAKNTFDDLLFMMGFREAETADQLAAQQEV